MNDGDETGAYPPGAAHAPAAVDPIAAVPQDVGRYRIAKLLGQSAPAPAYLAHDGQLDRAAGLHESRTGPWRGAPGRWPQRHLQPGRRLLRTAGRTPAVPGRLAGRDDGSGGDPRTSSAASDG